MREPRTSGWPGRRQALTALLPSLLAVLLVAAAFGLTAGRSLSLELQAQPPVWVVNAVPAAISELYFGHTKRYTILATVRERYFDSLPERNPSAKAVNLSMRKVREINPARIGTSYVLMGPDDKGIVDLVELSFLTFGYAAENITLMYFVILAASCLLYAAAFWRSPSQLLLAAALLAMLFLTLPMVMYHGQLRSILALRTMPVLSMVACLHCLLFMANSVRGRFSAWQLGLVTVQIALISFTIHLRATTLWQVMTVVGFGVVLLVAARFRLFGVVPTSWRVTGASVGAAVGLVLAGYIGVQLYQRYGLPEEYRRGDEIATRVFWHNIFSGLAYHPDFAERYQLRIDDSSIFAATGDYLAETGRLDLWREMGGEVEGFAGLKFTIYDPVVREMLVARCSTYFRECAEAMLYYKPVALAGNLAWLYGLRSLPPNLDIVVSRRIGDTQVLDQTIAATAQMDREGQRAYLWTPVVLLILLPFGLLLVAESRPSISVALAGAIGLLAGSLIPTVIGYPVPHTILEAALTFGMLGYLVICLAIARWLPMLIAHEPGRLGALRDAAPAPKHGTAPSGGRPAPEASSPMTYQVIDADEVIVQPRIEPGPGRPARLALAIGLLACGAAFALNVYRVRALEMDERPPVWVIHAIPAVLSGQLFGHPVRYTSLTSVGEQFRHNVGDRPGNAALIDAGITGIARLDPAQVGTAYELLGPEDKGIVDFIAAAFTIFGLHARSITWLYLAVLLASSLALLVASRGSLAIVAWLTAFLLAHALFMPMVVANQQLTSFLALRSVPVLSMVACFHLLIYVLRPSARPLDVALAVLQALLIVFLIHVRTTAQWQVMIVALVTITALVVRAWRDRRPSILAALRRQAAVGIPLAALAVGLLGLQVYRNVAFPVEYQRGDQILTRGFWHNIVSGLTFHPSFAQRERLYIDDISIMRAVGRYLTTQGREDEWVAMGGMTPSLTGLRWARYEPAARDYLLDTCRAEPDVCLATALYFKPRSLVGLFAWSIGLRAEPPDLERFDSPDLGGAISQQMSSLTSHLRAQRLFAAPWRPEALAVWALATITLLLARLGDVRVSLVAGLALMAGSTLTTIVGYPATWTMVDSGLAAEAVLYLVAGLGIAWLARTLTRPIMAPAATLEPTPASR